MISIHKPNKYLDTFITWHHKRYIFPAASDFDINDHRVLYIVHWRELAIADKPLRTMAPVIGFWS